MSPLPEGHIGSQLIGPHRVKPNQTQFVTPSVCFLCVCVWQNQSQFTPSLVSRMLICLSARLTPPCPALPTTTASSGQAPPIRHLVFACLFLSLGKQMKAALAGTKAPRRTTSSLIVARFAELCPVDSVDIPDRFCVFSFISIILPFAAPALTPLPHSASVLLLTAPPPSPQAKHETGQVQEGRECRPAVSGRKRRGNFCGRSFGGQSCSQGRA